MLKKVLLSLAMLGIAFVTGYATAQSYFLSNSPRSTGVAGNNLQSDTTLAQNSFQDQVQQLQQKKNQALSNQLNQNLAKVPPTPAPATPGEIGTPAANAPAASGETGTPTATPPASPETGTSPQAATPDTSQGAATQATAPAGTVSPEAPPMAPTPATPPTPAATPPQSQSQVYTGFQNQNQDTAPSNNQTKPSSGNWNIKY